jgi:uncharacterized protein YegP (UPF0339 family)
LIVLPNYLYFEEQKKWQEGLKSKKEAVESFANLKAGNGQIILSSESYETKQGSEKRIESVRKNAPDDNRYERKTAKNDEAFFVLKAGNIEPLVRGETFSSVSAMKRWYRISQKGRNRCRSFWYSCLSEC